MEIELVAVKNTKTRDSRIKKNQFRKTYDKVLHVKAVSGIELNSNDKILYSELLNDAPFYIRERGYYSPPIQTLGDQVGMSHSKAKRSMKRLIECGLVIVLNSKLGCANELGVVQLDGAVIQPKKDMRERMELIGKQKEKAKNDFKEDEYDANLEPW